VSDKPFALQEYFFEADPKMLYPKWSKDIWRLLQQGEVAIGMDEEMVAAAAGPDLYVLGSQVNDKGEASIIYACCGKKFLMRDGKVVSYYKE
jgi:hypothetical protein